MGGYGSGRWEGYTRRIQAEECRALDVRDLWREGLLKQGVTWQGLWWWRTPDGKERASITLTATAERVVVSYTIRPLDGPKRDPEQVGYAVPVVWTAQPVGGRHPWFLCPGERCGRRVAKLYLPLYVRGSRRFLCRHCWGLSYESRQTWSKEAAFYRRHPEALGGLLAQASQGLVSWSKLRPAALRAILEGV